MRRTNPRVAALAGSHSGTTLFEASQRTSIFFVHVFLCGFCLFVFLVLYFFTGFYLITFAFLFYFLCFFFRIWFFSWFFWFIPLYIFLKFLYYEHSSNIRWTFFKYALNIYLISVNLFLMYGELFEKYGEPFLLQAEFAHIWWTLFEYLLNFFSYEYFYYILNFV